MNGAPAKPISGVGPSSSTSAPTARRHVVDVVGLERSQLLEVALRADRRRDHRSDSRLDVEVDPDRLEGHHDVAEQDRRVHAVPANRLHRDLGDEVGAAARVEHRDALAQPAVLRQRPAGLAHEPHRRVRHGLAAAGAQEGRVGQLVGRHRRMLSRARQDGSAGSDQHDTSERRNDPDVLHRGQPLVVHDPGQQHGDDRVERAENGHDADQAAGARPAEREVGGGVTDADDGDQRQVAGGQPQRRTTGEADQQERRPPAPTSPSW